MSDATTSGESTASGGSSGTATGGRTNMGGAGGAATNGGTAGSSTGGTQTAAGGASGSSSGGANADGGPPDASSFDGAGSNAAPSSTGTTVLAAGSTFVCAVTSNGGVECWGFGSEGELGNGSTGSALRPTPVKGLSGSITSVSASGGSFACALNTNGGVQCWGQDATGELGNGIREDGGDQVHTTPVQVSGLTSGVKQISAGVKSACAVTTGGAVRCWGDNTSFQLGNSALNGLRSTDYVHSLYSSTPVEVSGLDGPATQVAVGSDFACALLDSGEVECWGDDSSGQLGDGPHVRVGPSNGALPVVGLTSGVTAIAAGGHVACAIKATDLLCWGDNSTGQLGSGAVDSGGDAVASSVVPVPFADILAPVSAVSVSGGFNCALTTSGAVQCWGQATNYQVDGTTSVPSGVAAVSVSDGAACVVLTNGKVECWGGYIGNGSSQGSFTPLAVDL